MQLSALFWKKLHFSNSVISDRRFPQNCLTLYSSTIFFTEYMTGNVHLKLLTNTIFSKQTENVSGCLLTTFFEYFFFQMHLKNSFRTSPKETQ